MRRDAIREPEKLAQPVFLVPAIKLNVFKRFGMCQHRANRDSQDINQPVLNLASLSRFFYRAKARQ